MSDNKITTIPDFDLPEPEQIARMFAVHSDLFIWADNEVLEGTGQEDFYMQIICDLMSGKRKLPDNLYPWMTEEELRDWMLGGLGLARHATCPASCPGHAHRHDGPPLRKPEHHQKDPVPAIHASGRAWVRQTLEHALIDAWRARNRHQEILDGAAREQTGGWLDGRKYTDSPESIIIRREEELEVMRRINRLPRNLREVAMPLLTGYTAHETAKSLGITAKAVYRRLDRIRSPRIRAALVII